MKNFKLSLLAFALFSVLSVSLTSCGGSEEEDPKPIDPKTDLELIQEALINVELHTVKADVTTPNGVLTIEDLCVPPAGYENTVEQFTFKFTSTTQVHVDNDCIGSETTLNYTLTQVGDDFNLQLKTTSIPSSVVVNAFFKKSDIIGADNKVLDTVKGTFKEITTPKNWEYSPVIYLQRQS